MRATSAGVAHERIVLDPGIGFGKTVAQNFSLMARQAELLAEGFPLLVGWSRKSSLAAVTQRSLHMVAGMDRSERMVPSVTAALIATVFGDGRAQQGMQFMTDCARVALDEFRQPLG